MDHQDKNNLKICKFKIQTHVYLIFLIIGMSLKSNKLLFS